MDSSWGSLFQVDRQNTDTATALFSFQSLRSLNLRRKRLKMRFVAQTRKRQGIRRPFERSENYVPPTWPSILYLRQSSAQ